MLRDAILACRGCGCEERSEMGVGEELHGRPLSLSLGVGALHRFGGCLAPCPCHDDFRLESYSPFRITIGAPRALALPRRP